MFRKMFFAAALPLALVAAAAPQDAPRSIRVSAAGLDLATAEGRALFQGRVERAVDLVCRDESGPELARRMRALQCRREALAKAQRDMNAVIAAATGGDRYAALTVMPTANK